MRQAAGKLTDGLQFLRLDQLPLQVLPLLLSPLAVGKRLFELFGMVPDGPIQPSVLHCQRREIREGTGQIDLILRDL